MTSPKMQQLERALSRTKAQPSVPNSNTSSLFLEAMEDSVAKISADKIALAEAMQKRAEDDCAESRRELAKINKEMMQMQKEMQAKIDNMISSHKAVMDSIRSSHQQEMDGVRKNMDALRSELAEAQKCMAGMEAKHEAAERMYANAEKMIGKLSVAQQAPIVQNVAPAAAPMKPVRIEFQRDGNGRIMSPLSFMPST